MSKKNSMARKPRKTLKRGGFKKRAVYAAKRKSLVKLIKSVSLKQAETKFTHLIQENIQLNHNSESVFGQILYTGQGIGDTDTGLSNYLSRVGDEIILRGLSFKFWFANKLDRPNVMYRVVIFKYFNAVNAVPTSVYTSQGTANLMIRDINREKFTVLYSKIFNLQSGTQIYNAAAPTQGLNKEAHRYLNVSIPLKNYRLTYAGDNSGIPKKWDIGMSVCCYDSYGTLITDNIASYSYHYKLYFKDP